MRKLLLIIVIMLFSNYKINGQHEHVTIQIPENKWEIINDNVMGGVSSGKFKIENEQIIFSENYHQNLMEALLLFECVIEYN